MEEGITHLNAHGTSNLLCDGWSLVGTKYVMERTVGDDGYYNVSIDNWIAATNCSPTIESRAFITPPVLVAWAGDSGPLLAAATVLSPSGKVGRGVKATVSMNSLFSKGLVAKGVINMNGNNIQTDSFDS